jgi:hypothetical protein
MELTMTFMIPSSFFLLKLYFQHVTFLSPVIKKKNKGKRKRTKNKTLILIGGVILLDIPYVYTLRQEYL